MRGLSCLISIEMIHSSCVQYYFVPLMNFQHMDLPCWSNLDVRHCIDVMHVKKNVCDSVIDKLLNIQGKTKDGLNTRLHLAEMGIGE